MKLRPWSKTYRGVAAIGSFLANSATNARRRPSSEFTASAGRLDLALHGAPGYICSIGSLSTKLGDHFVTTPRPNTKKPRPVRPGSYW
jgi:hypothetical protein